MPPSRKSTAPLESLVADWMRERRTGTLRFEDGDGQEHALLFTDGLHVVARSPATSATTGPDHRRAQAMHAAEALFRKSASAETITLDSGPVLLPPDAVQLDAFEVLYRGVRARFAAAPKASSVTRNKAPFALHRAADLDAFPLRPAEKKIVAYLENLARPLDDLRERRFLPDDELLAFLHFLLITHNVFRVGDDTSRLDPLGELTPEERLLRETREDAPSTLPPFASRAGLAFLGLTLVPLGVLLAADSDLPERIVRTTHTTPEIARHVAQSRERVLDLLGVVPDHKLEGAFLSRDSHAHWLCAAASLSLSLALLAFVFERGRASRKDLVLLSLSTGTVGVLLLFGVQWAGGALRDFHGVPTGVVAAVAAIGIYAVKFIAQAYNAAADPNNGFVMSLVGFTLGVGLCEEVVKILPITGHFRRKGTLDAHGALVWGLASGAGLGVAEGVLYGAEYNGIEPPLTYLVRFASCVSLHAIWTASAALTVHARRTQIHPRTNVLDRLITLLQVIAVPMVLHGLYDTLLKRDMNGPAFAVAVASFAYLIFRLARSTVAPPAPVASAPTASSS